MADFPPNLEDGENWLPSDIIREIQSTTVKVEDGYPETFGGNAFSYRLVHVPRIAVSPFLVPVIIASAQGAVPVLLPILYHLLPGPFRVADPIYVRNELSSVCYRGTNGPAVLIPSPFICGREFGVPIRIACPVFPVLHPNLR